VRFRAKRLQSSSISIPSTELLDQFTYYEANKIKTAVDFAISFRKDRLMKTLQIPDYVIRETSNPEASAQGML
jgi:hypothetical protein